MPRMPWEQSRTSPGGSGFYVTLTGLVWMPGGTY